MRNITSKVMGYAEVDLLITDAKVFNVFTMEFEELDVRIDSGKFVGFGKGPAKEVISAHHKYLIPGLIDSHMHVESTMLNPIEYSKVALANGITTVFADCHEIANVLGTAGIDYMLCAVERALIDINVMLPSSVPCSNLGEGGNVISAKDLEHYYTDPFVYGLAELMDFHRVSGEDQDYLKKIQDCMRRNLIVDGHMAGLSEKEVDLLRTHGVSTDHECETTSELISRLSRGVNIFIREGSAAKNFLDLMPAVTLANNASISFCSDDISIVDLIDKGSINNIIRIGIANGYKPELLLKMATYNAARTYNLNDKGAIAPGYLADFLIVDNLEHFTIDKVFKDGHEMSSEIDYDQILEPVDDPEILETINIVIDEKQIDLKPRNNLAIVIENGSLISGKHQVSDQECDTLNKVVVINRYGKTDYAVSYIKGIELDGAVIASSISHDDHNIVIIGSDDNKIREMISFVKKTRGGIYTLTDSGINHCPLDIAGLMSNESINVTYRKFKQLLSDVSNSNIDEPFLAMSFLTLDVIPYLKITDKGLYDFETNKIIED